MSDDFNKFWDTIRGGRDDDGEPGELDPLLKKAITDRNGTPYIRHPACCEEYRGARHGSYNQSLQEWTERRAAAHQDGNWRDYVECSDKLFHARALLEIKSRVSPGEWAQLVRNAWILSDELWEVWPAWREIFAQPADLPGFMTPAEIRLFDKLPDPITVYRSCRETTIDGLSWTTNWKAATHFEYQIKPRNLAIIVEGVVGKADVFAYVDKYEEFEIITFPEKVIGKKMLQKGGKWLDE